MAAIKPVVVQPMAPAQEVMSERTATQLAKVARIKALTLTGCETACVGLCGCLACLSSFGFGACVTVPASTNVALFRCGKLTGTISAPGCNCILPGAEVVQEFAGTRTQILDELRVIDASGNPIIVRALLEYAVDDPAALKISTGRR